MNFVEVKNLSLVYNVKTLDGSYLRKNLIKKLFLKKKNEKKQFWALKDINFKLSVGDRLGVVGSNGSGKSTLIRCLSGILSPINNSEINIVGKFLPIIEPWSLFEPTDSVVNNIFLTGLILGFKKEYIKNNLEKILDFSELSQYKNLQFSSLSTGMKLKLIFAIVFLLKTEIFFIDEFLTTGDERFREKSYTHLKEQTKKNITVICSHERNTIKSFCNKILVLNNGRQEFFGDIEEGFQIYDKLIKN